MARNHVISNFDTFIRECVQVLKLSGYASLDTLLELIQSKLIRELIFFHSYAATPEKFLLHTLENIMKQKFPYTGIKNIKVNHKSQ